MKISRIGISNFRNFSFLDVALDGDIVVVGENRVGKSNFLYALRLVFDATLPDSARQLGLSDFWDGLSALGVDDAIRISVDILDFDADPDILCLLTDFRLDDDPNTVRLTYLFRPKPALEGAPGSDADYEFICFGGESEAKRFGHDLRRRIAMELLPALRDSEGDLANWRRSPLRPLVQTAFAGVNQADLACVKTAIEAATAKLADFDAVKELEETLRTLFLAMSGPRQNVNPSFGFGGTDITRVYRNIRLLIDDGRRTISDASLGSANIVYLTLKTLDLTRQIETNTRDHTLLAIEEPEAHLHPHLQRSVYRHLFEKFGASAEQRELSIILTTHSPHIASIAPLRSILLLKDEGAIGTTARSAVGASLTTTETDDLARYLDVTRAEMLFARGVVLVEGDAEKFLFPLFAESLGLPLDHLGITICSVAGTNFTPYVKFLAALGIPYAVATDWDPVEGKRALGMNRAAKLVLVGEQVRLGSIPAALKSELIEYIDNKNENKLSCKCDEFGIFTNCHTFEVDLFEDGFADEVLDTLREQSFSTERKALIEAWAKAPTSLDVDRYLAMIEDVGKGRFAQRLASRLAGKMPLDYIANAIRYVANRV